MNSTIKHNFFNSFYHDDLQDHLYRGGLKINAVTNIYEALNYLEETYFGVEKAEW